MKIRTKKTETLNMYYIITEVDDVIGKNVPRGLISYIHRAIFQNILNDASLKSVKSISFEIENFKIKENL